MTNSAHNRLQDADSYEIYEFKGTPNTKVPGYFVVSTAALNVEDEKSHYTTNFPTVVNKNFFHLHNQQSSNSQEEMIDKIVKFLKDSPEPEIVINIHGYSATPSDAEIGCKYIYDYINQNINQSQKYLFIGYRWPAENPVKKDDSGTFKDKLASALLSLPILPATILGVGLAVTILSSIFLRFLYFLSPTLINIATSLLILSGLFSSIIFTLILLRISNYFRDVYRASNYGVHDLVELLRTLDLHLQSSGNNHIKLSFISHSLGSFLITNVIRILSDVFNPASINKTPDAKIGNAFCLGRLVLVAPDIPVETILPGRGNFLRSCLRRCEEAYIFSNEADLALRFTSTAANYFSFPARTRTSGYRLGNITVRHFRDKHDKVGYPPQYGIVNCDNSDYTQGHKIDNPYKYLEIRSSNREHRKLTEIRDFVSNEQQPADLFTYFDCTDYKDDINNNVGLLSQALQKPAINFRDYLSLSLAFIRRNANPNDPNGIDTHNGYFQSQFVQQAIYKLAFLGFDQYLQSLSITGTKEEQIQAFSQQCKHKQLQVVLAPGLCEE